MATASQKITLQKKRQDGEYLFGQTTQENTSFIGRTDLYNIFVMQTGPGCKIEVLKFIVMMHRFKCQYTYDIRFYPVILGVLIDDPIILLPEIAIPL